MNVLQKSIWLAMPHARQYGRALMGSTETTDLILAQATANVLKQTPAIRLLTPKSVVLPLLIIQFHKQIDADSNLRHSSDSVELPCTDLIETELFHKKIDKALGSLPELERRVFLLITVSQLKFHVAARVLSQPVERVNEMFVKAHSLVQSHLETQAMDNAA